MYQSNSLAIGCQIQPAISFPGVGGWVAGLNPILQLSSAQLNWDLAELGNFFDDISKIDGVIKIFVGQAKFSEIF